MEGFFAQRVSWRIVSSLFDNLKWRITLSSLLPLRSLRFWSSHDHAAKDNFWNDYDGNGNVKRYAALPRSTVPLFPIQLSLLQFFIAKRVKMSFYHRSKKHRWSIAMRGFDVQRSLSSDRLQTIETPGEGVFPAPLSLSHLRSGDLLRLNYRLNYLVLTLHSVLCPKICVTPFPA